MAELKKLKDDITSGEIANLYIFHGEESYLKNHYVKQLEKLCESPFPEFDSVRIDGDTVTADSFRDAIESLPMGGGKKIVEIYDYPLFGSGALKECLPEMIGELPDYICLIFVFEALEFKPDKRLTLYKTISKAGEIIEFKRADVRELIPWLKRRFSSLGKEISNADAERMLFICGGLMTNLVTEVEKIAAGTKGNTVTASDIEKMASRSLEAGIFDLTDRISEGLFDKALLVLRDLLDMKNAPVSIVSMLTKHFRRLYGAKLGMQGGLSTDEITKLLGFNSSYPAKIAMRSAQRMQIKKLRLAQKLCLDADIALKSNNSDDQRTLELLLLRLAA